jgi:hypothetical protein
MLTMRRIPPSHLLGEQMSDKDVNPGRQMEPELFTLPSTPLSFPSSLEKIPQPTTPSHVYTDLNPGRQIEPEPLIENLEPPTNSNEYLSDEDEDTDAGAPITQKKGIKPRNQRSHKKRRCLWTTEEDAKLLEQVEKYGPRQWSNIANAMGNSSESTRTDRQCRERWHNHLDPSIKKSTWTREEDKILIDAHQKGQVNLGHWADIAKRIPGRSGNAVRDRWRRTMVRAKRCKNPETFKKKNSESNGKKNTKCGILYMYCISTLHQDPSLKVTLSPLRFDPEQDKKRRLSLLLRQVGNQQDLISMSLETIFNSIH